MISMNIKAKYVISFKFAPSMFGNSIHPRKNLSMKIVRQFSQVWISA